MPDIALLGLIIPFLTIYIILLAGIKLFKIEPITQAKLLIFVIAYVLFGLFVGQAVTLVILPTQLLENSPRLLIVTLNEIISILVTLAVGYILIAYYLKLSGKQVWQLLIFLEVVSFILVYLAFSLP